MNFAATNYIMLLSIIIVSVAGALVVLSQVIQMRKLGKSTPHR
jgi:hypothetical protein